MESDERLRATRSADTQTLSAVVRSQRPSFNSQTVQNEQNCQTEEAVARLIKDTDLFFFFCFFFCDLTGFFFCFFFTIMAVLLIASLSRSQISRCDSCEQHRAEQTNENELSGD